MIVLILSVHFITAGRLIVAQLARESRPIREKRPKATCSEVANNFQLDLRSELIKMQDFDNDDDDDDGSVDKRLNPSNEPPSGGDCAFRLRHPLVASSHIRQAPPPSPTLSRFVLGSRLPARLAHSLGLARVSTRSRALAASWPSLDHLNLVQLQPEALWRLNPILRPGQLASPVIARVKEARATSGFVPPPPGPVSGRHLLLA